MADFQIDTPDTRGEGYGVYDADRRDYDQPARVLSGVTKAQAEYAVMVLNAGGLGDLTGLDDMDIEAMLEDVVALTTCDRCGAEMFRGEAQPDAEWVLCREHQS